MEEAVRQAAPLPALLAEAQKAAAEAQAQSTVAVAFVRCGRGVGRWVCYDSLLLDGFYWVRRWSRAYKPDHDCCPPWVESFVG